MASQTITGPDLQYTQDNKRCFAYSGNVTDAGTSGPNTTMLDYTTGSGYIVGQFQWEANNESSLIVDIVVEFNGVRIYDSEFDASPSRGMWNTPLDVIIPPFTHVVFKFGASGGMQAASQFTGRVYEYLPVRN